MYVTRPLSQLLQSAEAVATPPDGPNSGYLVIQDEASEYSCFNLFKNRTLTKMPFPQDKELIVKNQYRRPEDKSNHCSHAVVFVPVLDQPLSSNQYYVIAADGQHMGEAFTSSREQDEVACCFCGITSDVRPRPLDPRNTYQQFNIVPYQRRYNDRLFYGYSMARDGYPPHFLQLGGWQVRTRTRNHFKLGIAQGLDSKLRARHPEFDFPLSWKSSKPCVVGKWYSPFMFVNEGKVQDQMRRSRYYEVALEQRWEKVFSCKKNDCENQGNSVVIDVSHEKEEVYIGESKAVWNDKIVLDGVIWFTKNYDGGQPIGVGLRVELVERMKWEQNRGGWIGGEERQVKINTVEEFKEAGEWSEFGCYALVERFSLKRVDGSVVMSYDFKHFDQMKTKWESINF